MEPMVIKIKDYNSILMFGFHFLFVKKGIDFEMLIKKLK